MNFIRLARKSIDPINSEWFCIFYQLTMNLCCSFTDHDDFTRLNVLREWKAQECLDVTQHVLTWEFSPYQRWLNGHTSTGKFLSEFLLVWLLSRWWFHSMSKLSPFPFLLFNIRPRASQNYLRFLSIFVQLSSPRILYDVNSYLRNVSLAVSASRQVFRDGLDEMGKLSSGKKPLSELLIFRA